MLWLLSAVLEHSLGSASNMLSVMFVLGVHLQIKHNAGVGGQRAVASERLWLLPRAGFPEAECEAAHEMPSHRAVHHTCGH